VNKEAIIRDILRGTASVARSDLARLRSVQGEHRPLSYDLEKARALLKERATERSRLAFLVPESGSGMQSRRDGDGHPGEPRADRRARESPDDGGAPTSGKYLVAARMAEMSWNPSIGDPTT